MRRGGVLVLALLAALVWAPPTASAATNVLDQPHASPTSGTTSTLFRLRVAYQGRFPALAVTVTVANRTLAMSLTSGTSTDGTWEVSTRLPAGSWPVVFTAVPDRGNSPTLAGPTLAVMGQASATPAPPGGPPGDDSGADPAHNSQKGPKAGRADDAAASSATAPPAPTDIGKTDGGSPGHATNADPTLTPEPIEPAPVPPGPPAGGEAGSDDDGGAMSPPATDGSSAVAGERSLGGIGGAAPIGDGAGPAHDSVAAVEDGLLDGELMLTVAWAALTLAAGSVMAGLVLRRSRRETSDGEAAAAAAETEALLERRRLRRAHVLMPEDSIVAAMALDEADPAGRRTQQRSQRRRDAERR